MRTVVCVKQVPDSTIVKFDLITKSLENVYYILDPIDEVSISEAIKIREKNGGDVTAITLGAPRAENVLRRCLKMGVDSVVHLCNEGFDNLDSYSTSTILAKYISKLKYDLVLCGNQSMDEANGYVGTGIASLLDLPLVTGVTRIDIFADTNSAVVHRRLRGGDREIIETPLPAVLTVESVLSTPIYPRLRTILSGLKKDILKLDTQSSDFDLQSIESTLEILSISQPKPRLKKTATIDCSLSPHERMKLIASGGVQQKSSNVVKKQPNEAASDIIKFLIDNGIITVKR
jgi:electron transfer flavoprotein beta subunit